MKCKTERDPQITLQPNPTGKVRREESSRRAEAREAEGSGELRRTFAPAKWREGEERKREAWRGHEGQRRGLPRGGRALVEI